MELDPKRFFYEATIHICGSLEIEKVLQKTLRFLGSVMPADSITLHFYRGDLGAMKVLAFSDFLEARKLNYTVSLSPESIKLAEWPQKENVKYVNSPAVDAVMEQIGEQTGLFGRKWNLSHLIMRLNIEGARIADVAIQARGEGRFNEDHARLFSLLNEPIGIAMSNYLLFEEVLKLKNRLTEENSYLRRELMRMSGDEIIGAETGLKMVMDMARQVARLDTSILLIGETGVGKEIIANIIQKNSPRAHGPFIKVNCGAIPDTLLDSELFGYQKGAFTGASVTTPGRFERANGGAIFLDEVGELTHSAQVRLLRVLQTHEIERVGGAGPIEVDIRVIAATNRNLHRMVTRGAFREDLFYRLYVFPIIIPPLRQRKEDIPALVEYFIEKKTVEMKLEGSPGLEAGALERLLAYDWPGNVRELENLVERALIINPSGPLNFNPRTGADPEDGLGPDSGRPGAFPGLDRHMENHIRKALRVSGGKVQGPDGAAALLDVHPSTLRKRMRKFNIPFGRTARKA
ncbi:MAG: sigma 54-interacting transcriptional regulator [Pseudomonadota bacterium]